jgi:hypothetical protein
VEALVVSAVITIAFIGNVASINIATQQRNRAGEKNLLSIAIERDLAEIQDLATQLTCCSGACTLGLAGVPTDDTAPFSEPCNTANRRDDRYFFPQINNPTTTSNEPVEVEFICNDPNQGIISDAVLAEFNDLPMNADLAAAGGVRQPIVKLNAVQNQPGNQNILLVTYTDSNSDNAVVRVARVVPPMVAFCP